MLDVEKVPNVSLGISSCLLNEGPAPPFATAPAC